MNQHGFGKFYLVSVYFERSSFYDDKIIVSINAVWWIWQEKCFSCLWFNKKLNLCRNPSLNVVSPLNNNLGLSAVKISTFSGRALTVKVSTKDNITISSILAEAVYWAVP